MSFLRQMLSEGGTAPSTTRVCLLIVVLANCAPLVAWTVRYCFCAAAGDIPSGVIAMGGLVAGLIAGLKGFEKAQQVEGKKE